MSLSHLRKTLILSFFALLSLHVFCQPIVSSFAPVSGTIGTTVTINGSGFSTTPAYNIVYFGAVKATVLSASTTSLSVQVPMGASYQPLTVTTGGLTAYSNKPFTVTFPAGGRLTSVSLSDGINDTTDLHPNGIIVADFDGDGKPDIATANNYSINGTLASVSILRNVGSNKNVSFAPRQDLPNGVLTYAIASGDLDGDGKPDLVCSSIKDQTISVYRNTSSPGSISFATKIDLPAGDNTYSIEIVDFNMDGKPDIIFTNALSNSLTVYKNTGNTGSVSFAARQDFVTGLEPVSLAIGDFDGDNKPDVAVSNRLSKTISVFRNNSSTTIGFQAKVDFSSGTDNPNGITAGDLDGDGLYDLVVTNNNLYSTLSAIISFSIFKNLSTIGNISFGSKKDYSTGDAYQPALSDLNGDGKPDLLVPCYNDDVTVYENKSLSGSIILGPVNKFWGAAPYFAGIADFDGDGKPDPSLANFTGEFVTVYKNRVTEPGILSFTPKAAAAEDTIILTGVHFTGATSVTVGGIPVSSFTVVNDSTITTVVGNGSSDSISVKGPEGTGFVSGFTRILTPAITSFSPATGGTGTTITITGSHLNYVTAVSFGGVSATSFTVVNETTIKAVVGSGASGDVSVTSKGGTATLVGFVFAPAPVITSFTPTGGIEGTVVTIIGSNFVSVKSVKFGGVVTYSFQVVSSDTIKANVGKGATGDVTVTTDYGTGSLGGFIYLVPTISSFTPDSGLLGTKVTITGTNFTNVNDVKFGGTSATSFSVISTTTIEALVGAGASGEVVVTTAYGTAILSGFTHTGPPVMNSFSPTLGGPGTIVIITGNNFTHATEVSFGGIKADSFHIVSPTQIMAIVGSGSSGNVRVTTSFGWAEKSSFNFYPLPVITDFSPRSGEIGTAVKITGKHFDQQPQDNIVYFGAVRATVSSATDTSLMVTVPAGADYQPITVSVHNITANSAFSFAVTFAGGGIDFTQNSIGQRLDYPAVSSNNKKGFCAKDLDGDGRPELITSGYGWDKLTIMHNESSPGGISFDWPITYLPTGYSCTSMAISDFNGDGKSDLAAVNQWSNSVSIMKNKSIPGTLSFEPKMDIAVGSNSEPDCIATADLDGDGRPDIITNGGALKLYKNTSTDSSISFAGRVDLGSYPSPVFVTTGDLDGDGKEDIVTIASYYKFYVHRNISSPGRFAFAEPFEFPAGDNITAYTPSYISIEDLDGDGKKDLVLLNVYALTIFKNKSVPGQIILEKVFSSDLGRVWADAMTVADLDGDAKPEIIINNSDLDRVAIYRNTSTLGTISFTGVVKWTTIERPGTTAVCDLDGDGKPELCMTQDDSRSGIAVWENRVGTALPCAGSTVVLTSMLAGKQYQWQEFTSSGYVNITDNAYYSGATSLHLKITNVPAAWNNRYYRCLVDGTPVFGNTLVLGDTTIVKGLANAPATICGGQTFAVQFSGTPTSNISAVTELWESKNTSAFQLVDSKTFTGTALNFNINAGNNMSVNKYFFKIKTTSACAPTTTSDTATVTINSLDSPIINVNNFILSITNADINASYKWEKQNGTSWDSVAAGSSYTATSFGSYRAKMTKGNCFVYSEMKAIVVTAINPVNAASVNAVLYPNPTNGVLTIDSLKLSDKWKVLDIVSLQTGQTLLSISAVSQTKLTIHVDALSSGTYLAVLRRKDGSFFKIKFIKM